MGRFLNADALVSTGQGVLGNNMFAYCRNNPVVRIDISGTYDVDCFDSDCNPTTDEKEMWGRSSTGAGGSGIHTTEQSNGSGNNGGTQIYRYGGTSAEKLTPTVNDVQSNTGLSFSTKWKPGAATTTIEEINASGNLYAVQDTRIHVSVYPVGATVAEWYAQGANSPWTQTLVQMVSLA